MISKYSNIETPALLIDEDIVISNIKYMQNQADKMKVALRPHTKTHKMPYIANMQLEMGSVGIAVAKTGEAEVFAENGIKDIFIANEIVGEEKLKRVQKLSKVINISFGVDSIYNIIETQKVFEENQAIARVLIEIEVGENRSGVIEKKDFIDILNEIKKSPNVELLGIFSHDGNSYHAKDVKECEEIFVGAQKRTLEFRDIAKNEGFECGIVSIGSTPPFMLGMEVLEGITEVRIGTYVFMDASQGNAIGTYSRCGATVLTTVISKPIHNRVITDSGAKAITAQERSEGICKTQGKGFVKGSNNVYVTNVYDEHGIIYSDDLWENVRVGDKIEIIPNHICPVCNLYDKAYLVKDGKALKELTIDARGKIL